MPHCVSDKSHVRSLLHLLLSRCSSPWRCLWLLTRCSSNRLSLWTCWLAMRAALHRAPLQLQAGRRQQVERPAGLLAEHLLQPCPKQQLPLPLAVCRLQCCSVRQRAVAGARTARNHRQRRLHRWPFPLPVSLQRCQHLSPRYLNRSRRPRRLRPAALPRAAKASLLVSARLHRRSQTPVSQLQCCCPVPAAVRE